MPDEDQDDLFDKNIPDDDTDKTGLTAEATVTPKAAPKAKAKPKAQTAAPAPAKPADRVKIVLEENDNIPPTGLFIGVNGKGYLLKPGEEALVPEGVLNVLKDAIISVPVVDPRTAQVVGYRNRMRYPYRNA